MAVEDFYPDVTAVFQSHSMSGLLDSCARKWEFRNLYQHASFEEGFAAEVGKAMHASFQDWMLNRDEEHAIWILMETYPWHLAILQKRNTRSCEVCYATLMKLIHMVRFDEYELVQIKCMDGETRPGIEVPFRINITDFSLSDTKHIPAYYRGQVDFILYSRRENNYVVVDLKSTIYDLADYSPMYAYSDQCLPYGLVLERLLGHDLSGGFAVQYIVAKLDLEDPKVLIYTFQKDRADIEDWARGLMVRLNLLKFYANMGWFPRNSHACISFKSKCRYFEPCQSRKHKMVQAHLLNGNTAVVNPYDNFTPWVELNLKLEAA